jgi:Flp pilus assembly protein TadD
LGSPEEKRVSVQDRFMMLGIVLLAAIALGRPLFSYQAFLYGKMCSDAREHATAIRYLERAVALFPENARAWSHLGFERVHSRDTAGAIEAYTRALSLAPDDLHAATELALIYFDRADYRAAIAVLKKHLVADREETMSWLLLGRCYEKLGDDASARRIYEKIYYEIDPGNVVAKDRLGIR